jgi:hypothetical protein
MPGNKVIEQTDSQKIDRILSILENDESINKIGLVHQVHLNERRLNALEEREKIYTAKASILGFIGGTIITIVVWFIEHFLINKK